MKTTTTTYVDCHSFKFEEAPNCSLKDIYVEDNRKFVIVIVKGTVSVHTRCSYCCSFLCIDCCCDYDVVICLLCDYYDAEDVTREKASDGETMN